MKIRIENGGLISGYYHDITVIRNAGKENEAREVYCVDIPSKNLILDGFFTRWAAGGVITQSNWRFYVGSGATAPVNANTQLVSQIGPASNAAPVTQNANVLDGSDYIASCTAIAQWAIGAIVGNLSEIGLNMSASTTGTALDSRALIVDSVGSPTSISITADDQLVASYTLKYRIPIEQHVSVVSFDGVSTTCTLEALNVLNNSAWGLSTVLNGSGAFLLGGNQRISNTQGIVNDVTFSSNIGTASAATLTAVQNGTMRRVRISASTSQFNEVGSISYVQLINPSPFAPRQGIHFSPSIAKTNLKSLVLDFDYALARA